MPLKLDARRKLTARSDRVKSVDLHPREPWMLVSLYNGNVHVWNHDTQQLLKTFETGDLPVRTAKFVVRKHWIVVGSDDLRIRVFNVNTFERIQVFEAHADYIRCIAIHPTRSLALSSSDDTTVKLWDWDKGWNLVETFEDHAHYVMQVVFNPKDNNSFASASLDKTIKVWQLGSKQANFTLIGHERGINCLAFHPGGDKPYLVSGGDDNKIKIWDYQNKTCVQTLDGHVHNVSSVAYHHELPIILSASEDGTVKVWHASTYRLESTLNYGMERAWAIGCQDSANHVALGYDEGAILLHLGQDAPAVCMDSGGKIVAARHSEIQQANLRSLPADVRFKDGERLPVDFKELGSCEVYPQSILHSPNGRFVSVVGDGEFVVYTAMALRSKAFGVGLNLAWAKEGNEFAVTETYDRVKIFKNFKERKILKPDSGVEKIFGGNLLGLKSSTGLSFYDWETAMLVRRIDISPTNVFWSESGDLLCIATTESSYVLRYDAAAVSGGAESSPGNDGVESAFKMEHEAPEVISGGVWVGDVFVYVNSINRLNYFVGGEIFTVAHLDRAHYLLGYLPKDERIYLSDKELNVTSYCLRASVLEYQTYVVRADLDSADEIFSSIPEEEHNRLAFFLQKKGLTSRAFAVTSDPDHRFDLALQLGDLKAAFDVAEEGKVAGADLKWKRLADLASNAADFDLAKRCLQRAEDFSGLLLLSTAAGDASSAASVAIDAAAAAQNNVAFMAAFLLGDLEECLDILVRSNRVPEAALFARSYLPSRVSEVVGLWRRQVAPRRPKVAAALADPADYENLFPGLREGFQAEKLLMVERRSRFPASSFPNATPNQDRDVRAEVALALASGSDLDIVAADCGIEGSRVYNPNDGGESDDLLDVAASAPTTLNGKGEEDEKKSTMTVDVRNSQFPNSSSADPPSYEAETLNEETEDIQSVVIDSDSNQDNLHTGDLSNSKWTKEIEISDLKSDDLSFQESPFDLPSSISRKPLTLTIGSSGNTSFSHNSVDTDENAETIPRQEKEPDRFSSSPSVQMSASNLSTDPYFRNERVNELEISPTYSAGSSGNSASSPQAKVVGSAGRDSTGAEIDDNTADSLSSPAKVSTESVSCTSPPANSSQSPLPSGKVGGTTFSSSPRAKVVGNLAAAASSKASSFFSSSFSSWFSSPSKSPSPDNITTQPKESNSRPTEKPLTVVAPVVVEADCLHAESPEVSAEIGGKQYDHCLDANDNKIVNQAADEAVDSLKTSSEEEIEMPCSGALEDRQVAPNRKDITLNYDNKESLHKAESLSEETLAPLISVETSKDNLAQSSNLIETETLSPHDVTNTENPALTTKESTNPFNSEDQRLIIDSPIPFLSKQDILVSPLISHEETVEIAEQGIQMKSTDSSKCDESSVHGGFESDDDEAHAIDFITKSFNSPKSIIDYEPVTEAQQQQLFFTNDENWGEFESDDTEAEATKFKSVAKIGDFLHMESVKDSIEHSFENTASFGQSLLPSADDPRLVPAPDWESDDEAVTSNEITNEKSFGKKYAEIALPASDWGGSDSEDEPPSTTETFATMMTADSSVNINNEVTNDLSEPMVEWGRFDSDVFLSTEEATSSLVAFGFESDDDEAEAISHLQTALVQSNAPAMDWREFESQSSEVFPSSEETALETATPHECFAASNRSPSPELGGFESDEDGLEAILSLSKPVDTSVAVESLGDNRLVTSEEAERSKAEISEADRSKAEISEADSSKAEISEAELDLDLDDIDLSNVDLHDLDLSDDLLSD